MCVIVWRQENATEFILKCRISGRWRWATPGLHYQTIKSLRENTVSPLTSTGVCRAVEIHTFKFLSNGVITALIVCVSFGIFKDKTILHHTCVLCDSSGTEPVCFEDMTLGLDEVRRLSTESSVLFPSFILTTTWIWYWRDQYDHWIQYASMEQVTWIKKRILQDTGIQILPREMFLPIISRSSFWNAQKEMHRLCTVCSDDLEKRYQKFLQLQNPSQQDHVVRFRAGKYLYQLNFKGASCITDP